MRGGKRKIKLVQEQVHAPLNDTGFSFFRCFTPLEAEPNSLSSAAAVIISDGADGDIAEAAGEKKVFWTCLSWPICFACWIS